MDVSLIQSIPIFTYMQDNAYRNYGNNDFGVGQQDYGYVTVRPGAHIFWWLYYVSPLLEPTDFDIFNKPLLIWLQESSEAFATGYGKFASTGQNRSHTLINDYNILCIDSPVGTGFSYVEKDSQYANSNEQIAKDLLEVIKKFLYYHPKFRTTPTFVVGQSYGGKVAVELAFLWNQAQENGRIYSQLNGIALGNPWISPIDSILSWAPYLQSMGKINNAQYNEIQERTNLIVSLINAKLWHAAYWTFVSLQTFIKKITILSSNNTQNSSLKDFSGSNQQTPLTNLDKNLKDLMNRLKISLNLESSWVRSSKAVSEHLSRDLLKPVSDLVERLLNDTNLKVFVFTGVLDSIISSTGTLAWINKLKWKHANDWENSPELYFKINNSIGGSLKEYKNFKVYWIESTGHHVFIENPIGLQIMLRDLTIV